MAILSGLLEGMLIALLGVGVVLIYRAERFVNLANAQLGVLSSLLLGKLVIDAGVSWYVAFVVAAAVGVLVGAAVRSFVIARIETADTTSLMIATLGVGQLVVALAYFEWVGPDRARLRDEGYPLPFEVFWAIDGSAITARHVLIAVLVPAILVPLFWWLEASRVGRDMRAVASNRTAARLMGVDVRRTCTVAWAIAGGLGAVGAVLAAPGQAVIEVQSTGPLFLLLSLGAAGIAGFTSLGGAVVAGVALGIVESVAAHVGHSTGVGVAAVSAAVLVGFLARARLVGSGDGEQLRVDHSQEPIPIPPAFADRWLVRRRGLVVGGAATAVGATLPFLPWLGAPHRTFVLAHVAVFALATLSLTLLTGWGGQVSLGQFAFVAVGALTATRLAPRGWSLLATMIVAAAIGAVFAAATGLPALRSRRLTFAVTSLAFAVVGPMWLFQQPWFAPEGTSTIDAAYQPGFGRLDSQREVYVAALVVLVVVGTGLARLRRTNVGRSIVAVRDDVRAAATFGIAPSRVRVATFAMSGALAAIAGVLWAMVNRNVSAHLFHPDVSLLLLAAAVIGGVGSVAGAVIGSIILFGLPVLFADVLRSLTSNTLQLQHALAGAGLLITQLVNPDGIAGRVRRIVQRRLDGRPAEGGLGPGPVAPRPTEPSLARARHAPAAPALSTSVVRVAFGGVTAVDGVSIEVAAGEIVGVIGANGAGKTSLLDAISGLVPAQGSVVLFGREAGTLPPERRARLGVSRGFQDARLFPTLTVRETVELALERSEPTGVFGALIGAPWVRDAARRRTVAADGVIARFGLLGHADVPIDRLSTGIRRLCDLAAHVATDPGLMIFDEPTSGLAPPERSALVPLLRGVAHDLGSAVLLVEHDTAFLRAVADRVYRLERGRVVAVGPPASMLPARGRPRRARRPIGSR